MCLHHAGICLADTSIMPACASQTREELKSVQDLYDEFRLGRVGTYIVNDRQDLVEDSSMEDDYSQVRGQGDAQ